MDTQCAQLCLFWNALTCALILWWFYQALKGNVDVNFHPDQQSHLQQNTLQLTDTWNSPQSLSIRHTMQDINSSIGVQELCESRGGRPGLPVLMSLMVFVDVKQQWTMLMHWSVCPQYVNPTSEDIKLYIIFITNSRSLQKTVMFWIPQELRCWNVHHHLNYQYCPEWEF